MFNRPALLGLFTYRKWRTRLALRNALSVTAASRSSLEPSNHEGRVVGGFVDQGQPGKAVDEAAHRLRQFEAGQWCTDAEVDAATEADVGGVVAPDVEGVRIVEPAGITLR